MNRIEGPFISKILDCNRQTFYQKLISNNFNQISAKFQFSVKQFLSHLQIYRHQEIRLKSFKWNLKSPQKFGFALIKKLNESNST